MPLSDADAARALDAWLKEHLGSAGRREAVRAVADRLEDLTGCEYDDLDEALELSTWPNLTRKRFVAAWRRLKAEAAPMSAAPGNDTDDDFDELYSEVAGAPAPPSVTPDAPRAAPTRVAAPPPLPLSPASSAGAPSTADSASDDDATGDEPPARRPAEAKRTKATAKAKAKTPAAPADATAGDAELARRLAMGLPPRRASRGPTPVPAPAPPRPPPEASDAEADEGSDDDVPLSQWQAQAAAAPWAVGDKVEAKFCVKGSKYSRDFYPATITAVHGATVDVEYDTSDEETEEQLPLRHVRKRRHAAAAPAPAAAPPKKKTKKAPAKARTPHKPDDERSRLMARCLRRGIPFAGNSMSDEWMRAKLAEAGDDGDDELREGGACFCRWDEKWYGAKILSVDDGSYRVHFLGWGKRYDGTYPAEAVRPAR